MWALRRCVDLLCLENCLKMLRSKKKKRVAVPLPHGLVWIDTHDNILPEMDF